MDNKEFPDSAYLRDHIEQLKYFTGETDNDKVVKELKTIVNLDVDQLKELARKRPEIKRVIGDILKEKTTEPERYANNKGEVERMSTAAEAKNNHPITRKVARPVGMQAESQPSTTEVDKLFDPPYVAKVKQITGYTPIELVSGLRSQIMNSSVDELMAMSARTPELAEPIAEVIIAKIADPEKYAKWQQDAAKLRSAVEKAKNRPMTPPPAVMQGDTRGLVQQKGLHTPTIMEIIEQANQPNPTEPYFEAGGNVGRWINPLEPHWNLSGDFAKLVDPRNPPPKISGLG